MHRSNIPFSIRREKMAEMDFFWREEKNLVVKNDGKAIVLTGFTGKTNFQGCVSPTWSTCMSGARACVRIHACTHARTSAKLRLKSHFGVGRTLYNLKEARIHKPVQMIVNGVQAAMDIEYAPLPLTPFLPIFGLRSRSFSRCFVALSA